MRNLRVFFSKTLIILLVFAITFTSTGLSEVTKAYAATHFLSTDTLWHSVYRGLNYYDVYKIESGGNVVGVYATHQNGDRVSDPSFEKLLIFDAATLDKDASSFHIPGIIDSIQFLNTWGSSPLEMTSSTPNYTIYTPYFMEFSDPSSFINDSIAGPGCFVLLDCVGLDNFDHQSELYGEIMLSAILQSSLSEASQDGRRERIVHLLEAEKEAKSAAGKLEDVEFIDKLLLGGELTFMLIEHKGVISSTLGGFAGRVSGVVGAGVTAVEIGLTSHDLNLEISYNNLLAAIEFQLALEDAEQRLKDLKTNICGEDCSLYELENDPMAKGISIAESRYYQLYFGQRDEWVDQLTNPAVAKHTIDLITAVSVGIIQLAGIVAGSAAAPIVLVGGLVFAGISAIYKGAIDTQEGLDNLRKAILANTLQQKLLDSPLPFNTNRRYALSLLNLAYYNYFLYFDQIYERATNDEQHWIWEESPDLCYGGNYTAICTRQKVQNEALAGRDWATTYYILTQYGTYLTQNERAYWKSLIIPDTSNPVLNNPLVTPGSGGVLTDYYFSVTYSDEANNIPDEFSIYVDDVKYPLTIPVGNPIAGIVFTKTLSGFNIGQHNYYFEAKVGAITAKTNKLFFTVMETPEGHDLALHIFELGQSSAEPGDSVTIRAQVNNNGIYSESNAVIDVTITGPGGYNWTDSKNIGTLGASGSGTSIWGKSIVTTWGIPNGADMGDYQIRATVSSSNGDENWSDNTITRSIRVSDQEPAFSAYSYKYYQIEWTSNHPADNYAGDLMGPLTTSYNGNTYEMYVHKGSNDFRIHLEKNGSVLVGIFDDSFDYDIGYYEDNDDFFFAVDFRTDNFIWMRAGHPVSGASITPAEKTITMGETGAYIVHIPCSSCSYGSNDPTVFEGNNSTNPRPYLDRDLQDLYNWDISKNGQDFTITAEAWTTSTRNFVFMTESGDLTTMNYLVFGKITGYILPDNSPTADLVYPNNNQTISGNVDVSVTALDDYGISKVEFLINGVVKKTDTSSPYTFAWNTTTYADAAYTVNVKAYDTKNKVGQDSANVIVDNNGPAFTNIQINPANPSNLDTVIGTVTITDASSIASAHLFYSSNGGNNWSQVSLTNTSGTTWQGTIPAHSQGTMLYKLSATDAIGRTTETSNQQYTITDQSKPEFYGWVESPSDLSENNVGSFRIAVSISDQGGSGLVGQIPIIDYRIGAGSYNGYENMTNSNGNTWYFDIPPQDWNSLQGQMLYYKLTVSDNNANVKTIERSELIDAINDPPRIDTYSLLDLTPVMDPYTCQTFSITASDEESPSLAYSWTLDSVEVSTTTSYEYCPIEADLGSHDLVVIVSDGNLTDNQAWAINVSGDTPEIDIQRPVGNSISDGGVDNIGDKMVSKVVTKTYTIDNSAGTDPLQITGIGASNSANIGSVVLPSTFPITIPAGSSATLEISFTVTGGGAFNLDLAIANDDLNENPYNISIQGVGIPDSIDPVVNVNSPNGRESLAVGSIHNITWSATDNIGVSYVNLEYSTNGGSSWVSIASNESNDGKYAWTIPNVVTSTAKVKITAYDAAGNSSFDVSNADFSISADPYEPDDLNRQSAVVLKDGNPITRSIDPAGDVDWFVIKTDMVSAITLETYGPDPYGDTVMYIYDSNLNYVTSNDDGEENWYSYLSFECGGSALPPGTYYIRIHEYFNNGIIPSYTLEFNSVETCYDDYLPYDMDRPLDDSRSGNGGGSMLSIGQKWEDISIPDEDEPKEDDK